jgi:amidase
MTGQPTLTMPSGFTAQGIPTAVQLTAGHLGEAVLIRAGRAFQGVTDWHRRHPDASRWAGSASVG